ncbi:hypothetical protein WQE_34431 [Paraburkholderia hospita]|uniref:Uncharacterized protein n=1 Tax=Paraburkholderia hospita TaxID=169430 RepID=A0ABN0FCQ5_9BURK|nr:hypothetical protein WQE_34431 [Paraburkholderia hospita]
MQGHADPLFSLVSGTLYSGRQKSTGDKRNNAEMYVRGAAGKHRFDIADKVPQIFDDTSGVSKHNPA